MEEEFFNQAKMKVWKLNTELSYEEYDAYTENLTIEDMDYMLEHIVGEVELFNYDTFIDGKFIPFVICTEKVLEVICVISSRHGMDFKPEDATYEFLRGDFNTIVDEDFDEYRRTRITEDIVYDKIKKFGVESLNDDDKNLLNSLI